MVDKLQHITGNAEKRRIKNIFKQRIADDQFQIMAEIAVIKQMMNNNYKSEYSHVLTKMLRFCNSMKEKEKSLNVQLLNVPEDILNMNIVEYFEKKGLNFDRIHIEPMNENVAEEYFKLFP